MNSTTPPHVATTATIEMYTVVEFGCNSSYNDMYPPTITAFYNHEEAYMHYMKSKDDIVKMKKLYGIGYTIDEDEDGECIIQDGDEAKRPVGVKITKHTIAVSQ